MQTLSEFSSSSGVASGYHVFMLCIALRDNITSLKAFLKAHGAIRGPLASPHDVLLLELQRNKYRTVGRVFFSNFCGHCYCFWLKFAGYLAIAGLNLLAQISDRISPFGV